MKIENYELLATLNDLKTAILHNDAASIQKALVERFSEKGIMGQIGNYILDLSDAKRQIERRKTQRIYMIQAPGFFFVTRSVIKISSTDFVVSNIFDKKKINLILMPNENYDK